MTTKGANLNGWKLSTIVLAAVLFGFILAQLTGLGTVTAQSGAVAKVQLDTSNCSFGVAQGYSVPPGAFVVQAAPSSMPKENQYVFDVCR